LEEDLSVDARLLADRLRRFTRDPVPDAAFGSGREADGAFREAVFSEAGTTTLLRSTETIDLEEAWSALETVRAEVAAESDPASRANLHSRLDRAFLELARAAVSQEIYSNQRAIEDISHDIRSPLNSILLLTDSLLHGSGESLSPAQQRQASVLLTAAVALVRLVNDVMDASRLGSGRWVPDERALFSLNEVLVEARRLVAPLAVHRSVELVFESTPGRRLGDRQLLCRVLINLSSNAVEAAGGEGTVTVSLDESDPNVLRVHVIDSGVDADLDLLREMIAESSEFYPRSHQGWTRGLGLAICGRLVRTAAGTISVESLEDGRTCFIVELPFAEA
jgi:signal transduction histidine kinase